MQRVKQSWSCLCLFCNSVHVDTHSGCFRDDEIGSVQTGVSGGWNTGMQVCNLAWFQ